MAIDVRRTEVRGLQRRQAEGALIKATVRSSLPLSSSSSSGGSLGALSMVCRGTKK